MEQAENPIDDALLKSLPPELREFAESLRQKGRGSPVVVALMGKTGSGKSSTGDALFGCKPFEVSDVEPCTRKPATFTNGSLTVVDLPGHGESLERDQEYFKLYREILTNGVEDCAVPGKKHQIDIVLYVMMANDKAIRPDVDFFNAVFHKLVQPESRNRFVVGLNQADKFEPTVGPGSWDVQTRTPGALQLINLDAKAAYVAKQLNLDRGKVVFYAAQPGGRSSGLPPFNLPVLLRALLEPVSADKLPIIFDNISNEYDPTLGDTVKETFWEKVEKFWEKHGKTIMVGLDVLKKLFDDWFNKKGGGPSIPRTRRR